MCVVFRGALTFFVVRGCEFHKRQWGEELVVVTWERRVVCGGRNERWEHLRLVLNRPGIKAALGRSMVGIAPLLWRSRPL